MNETLPEDKEILLEVFLALATRVSYPLELKMKAIEMRLAEVPVKEVMEKLGMRNMSQLKHG